VLRGARRFASRVALPVLEQRREGFAGSVVRRISEARTCEIDSPPLDHWRFPGANARPYDPSQAFQVLSFIRANAERLNRVAEAFEDDTSRSIYADLWAYRALGPSHVRLAKANSHYLSLFDKAREQRVGDSVFEFPPFEVHRYATSTGSVDCWLGNVIAVLEGQYWFERDGVRIAPEKGEVVIDGGACFGDTAIAFAEAVGPDGHVHAFEPLASQLKIVEHNLKANPSLADRVTVHPFALDEVSGRELHFSQGAGAHRVTSGERVETRALDDLELERVNYIKLDIEGAESACLRGAANTIRRCRPKLGISIYHSMEDMIALPLLVREIEPGYRLYIDHHTIHSEETVLYAVHG
jgi:FkbM family methyltransferase